MALAATLSKQEDNVSDHLPVRRPPVEGGPLDDDRPLSLARLFALYPAGGGILTAAHLEPLRACIEAARLALDALRWAAEDAVSLAPVMPLEAAGADVLHYGAALAAQLDQAAAEVHALTAALREGASDAS